MVAGADKATAEENEPSPAVLAGQRLVRQRARQRASLQAASHDLHIPVAQLEALEQGDFSGFSAEIYAQGAYTAYASWLGLPRQESQRAVSRALAPGRVHVPFKMHTPETWWQRLVTPRSVIIAAGTCVALVVGGYITWQLLSFWQLPALEVSSPERTYIEDESIMVRGRSEPDSRVRLNGETVLLQEDATFEASLFLHPGINVIQVEAENAAGRIHTIERHVLRPRHDS